MLGVFVVSAVVHEYIICFVLGFFYPVMLILFLAFGGELGFYVPLEEGSSRGRMLLLLENPNYEGSHTPKTEGTWEQGGRQHLMAARGCPGGCGRRFLTPEEHLSGTHTEGDKGEKTGGGWEVQHEIQVTGG